MKQTMTDDEITDTDIFMECVNRGLWLCPPSPSGSSYVVSDVDGVSIAHSKSPVSALLLAHARVRKELKRGRKTLKTLAL